LNDDYSAHRADGCGIDLPTVTVAPKNFFQHWLASQNKIGEQFKVPRVVDTATGQSLINFMSQFE
ncbi:MAG: GH3 auxin-responsive promoter family protein, partial [Deltaproteobacteria bacterium]|nr:GH3 auxin-responsive promoter family protein [Deltaproteobacteria bacterium]